LLKITTPLSSTYGYFWVAPKLIGCLIKFARVLINGRIGFGASKEELEEPTLSLKISENKLIRPN